MIFRSIRITNLFSYKGVVAFDLAREYAGRGNVFLIMGRNGFGKTSLLNSVKLLFLGTEERSQRRIGFPPRYFGRSDYVLGVPGKWAGIMNRRAKNEGERRCSIRIELGTKEVTQFTAERSWEFSGTEFTESLKVITADREFSGEAAEQRLADLLPKELVPYYFFDGEEIQTLAEAGDAHRAEAIERLLSLSFINGVESELAELAKKWRRDQLPEEVRAKVVEVEAKIEAIKARNEARERKAEELRRQQEEFEEESTAIRERMEMLREGRGAPDLANLENEVSKLASRLENEQSVLAYAVAQDAPVLANPSLVRAAIPLVQSAIDVKAKKAESVLETLFEVLPQRLFEEPPQPKPSLTSDQVRFYSTKLRRILDSFGVDFDVSQPMLDSIDLPRARALLEKILGVNASVTVIRQELARRIKVVSGLRNELDAKKAELRELEFGSSTLASGEDLELEAKFKDAQQNIGRIKGELERLEEAAVVAERDEKQLGAELMALEREAYSAEKNSTKLKIAVALRETIQKYRDVRRKAKRQEIEHAINKKFRMLMSGHPLIERITVDESFFMGFVDKGGSEVGRATISHGMRQLAVTALLWALKDVSGRDLPVIVDTPLARIDRENQENLLKFYYPNAAGQVLILATDSEIDDRKFKLIEPDLAGLLVLSNKDGESTSVSAGAPFVSSAASEWGHHG